MLLRLGEYTLHVADENRQLPQPSQYLSLTTLLSSDRSNDDIQSELVEVLGFEGDGLALVEELLRPGVREALLDDLRGGSRVRPIKLRSLPRIDH